MSRCQSLHRSATRRRRPPPTPRWPSWRTVHSTTQAAKDEEEEGVVWTSEPAELPDSVGPEQQLQPPRRELPHALLSTSTSTSSVPSQSGDSTARIDGKGKATSLCCSLSTSTTDETTTSSSSSSSTPTPTSTSPNSLPHPLKAVYLLHRAPHDTLRALQ